MIRRILGTTAIALAVSFSAPIPTLATGSDAKASSIPNVKGNPVVLIINGRSIYLEELLRDLESLPPEVKGKDFKEIYPILLKRAVQSALILEAANKAGVRNDPQFKKLRLQLEERALQQFYISKFVSEVTEADVAKRYAQFVKDFPKGKERRISHILVNTKDEVQKVLDGIKGGKAFEEMAKTFSVDRQSADRPGQEGEVGWVRAEQLPEELAKHVFAAKAGETPEKSIKTKFGEHVVFVHEERDSMPPSLDEARDLIRFKLAEERVSQEVDKASRSAKIQTFDMNGKPIPDQQ